MPECIFGANAQVSQHGEEVTPLCFVLAGICFVAVSNPTQRTALIRFLRSTTSAIISHTGKRDYEPKRCPTFVASRTKISNKQLISIA